MPRTEAERGSGAWRIMRPVRGQIRFAMALAVASAMFGLAGMGLLALTLHRLMAAPAVWPWESALGVLACTVAAYLLRLSAFDQSHYAAFRLETRLRTALAERLAQVSLGYVQDAGAGALAKVVHDDVKALHVFVADSTPLYARAYVTPVVTFAALLWLDWRLALGATAVLVFGFAVLGLAMRNRGEMTRLYNAAREQVSAAVVEFVQAMPVVRTFDSGESTFGRYRRALDNYLAVVSRWYREAGFAARFAMAVLTPMPTLAVLLWLGAWLTWTDRLDFGRWLAVLLLGTGMAEAMMPMMMLKHLVDKVKLSIARIEQVLAAPTLAPSAQAGPSGAGKTTVARLIPRFWDVTAGRILVGGVDVREMPAETLMRHVAFVFQDSFLFHDSIAANIRLGTPEADMAAVVAAAKAAQAHDFIAALPQGYDTLAGERGAFLSGGQRQRIAIARAILQNRPILVLDEATAFADPENEAALVAALSELMRGKTVILVAHRLNTVRDADRILVFDRGRLVESGRHDELLAGDGTYVRLWRSHERAQAWALGGGSPATEAR